MSVSTSARGAVAEPAGVGASPPRVRTTRRRGPVVTTRAVVGGLLVAASAVLCFAAYTSASADHRVRYVVAARALTPGERITAADLTTAPMQLPGQLADTRAFRSPSRLLGAYVVGPVGAGELVQASDVARAGPGGRQLSFAIDPSRAVDGTLQPGERVDVLATYGTGSDAQTVTVAQGAEVVSVDATGDALGGRTSETVTLAVDDATVAAAVANAVNAGQVTLVRADGAPASGDPPAAYRTPPAPSPSSSQASPPQASPPAASAPAGQHP